MGKLITTSNSLHMEIFESSLSHSLKPQLLHSSSLQAYSSNPAHLSNQEPLSLITATSTSSTSRYKYIVEGLSSVQGDNGEYKSVERGAKDRHLMQSFSDVGVGGNGDQAKYTVDRQFSEKSHHRVPSSPTLPHKEAIRQRLQKVKNKKWYLRKYPGREHLSVNGNRNPENQGVHNVINKVLHGEHPTMIDISKQLRSESQEIDNSNLFGLTESERRWRKMKRFHARNKGVGISKGLLKLAGVTLPPPSSLRDRGFPVWHNTSEVASHLPNLLEAVKQVHTKGTPQDGVTAWSLNPDIVARGHVSYTYTFK